MSQINTLKNAAPKKKKQGFIFELKKNKALFLMLSPAIIFFITFQYYPMSGIVLAFKKYHFNKGIWGSPWVGFENFDFFFRSGNAFNITKNTVVYNLIFIVTGLILQILVALIIYELSSKFIKKYVQGAMLIPYFISWVVVGTFVYNLLNYEYGVVNNVLSAFGMDPLNFYNSADAWPGILVFANNWKSIGYSSLIYLAALLGIDKTLYEAAKIDGATFSQRVRHITLPLLTPTIVTLLLLSIGQIFRGNFEMFYNLVGTNGVLYNATDVIDTYVFRALLQGSDMGMTTAIGLYQSVLCFVIIMSVNAIIKRVNKEYSLF